jgi:hypothetical protein
VSRSAAETIAAIKKSRAEPQSPRRPYKPFMCPANQAKCAPRCRYRTICETKPDLMMRLVERLDLGIAEALVWWTED